MDDCSEPICGGPTLLSFLWIVEEQLLVGRSCGSILFDSHGEWNTEFYDEGEMRIETERLLIIMAVYMKSARVFGRDR